MNDKFEPIPEKAQPSQVLAAFLAQMERSIKEALGIYRFNPNEPPTYMVRMIDMISTCPKGHSIEVKYHNGAKVFAVKNKVARYVYRAGKWKKMSGLGGQSK